MLPFHIPEVPILSHIYFGCSSPVQECVHLVCRLGQLTVQHCAKYKRLEVQESREARTAIEHMDELMCMVSWRSGCCRLRMRACMLLMRV